MTSSTIQNVALAFGLLAVLQVLPGLSSSFAASARHHQKHCKRNAASSPAEQPPASGFHFAGPTVSCGSPLGLKDSMLAPEQLVDSDPTADSLASRGCW